MQKVPHAIVVYTRTDYVIGIQNRLCTSVYIYVVGRGINGRDFSTVGHQRVSNLHHALQTRKQLNPNTYYIAARPIAAQHHRNAPSPKYIICICRPTIRDVYLYIVIYCCHYVCTEWCFVYYIVLVLYYTFVSTKITFPNYNNREY